MSVSAVLGEHITAAPPLIQACIYLSSFIYMKLKGVSWFQVRNVMYWWHNECQYFRGAATEELQLEHAVTGSKMPF